ncbi:hypothetical protein KVR01_008219 [Diaporthe batatas]|uniref:uncharacterized protein n=1 Tax=Diaporthe batatas TaxID=748121 RepID=UPI001D04251E|nr:uncharacterized protein KVR01_008219 [Diaporthe batatas]KAG8162454.1 hypothetical protein KVR01_008219 [Diaporthe batatas]
MLQSPSPRSHPVLIARKLLLLATFMQGITADAMQGLEALSISHKSTMSRLAEVSSKSVTSDDELVGSLEGIECIMIEAMYHNNAGNFRRAWVTHRRAMTIAQMLGLDRGAGPRVLLDEHDQGRIDPEHMWYRLVISDRYLSLILGLPQGAPENPFASPQALESCTALERLERMEAVAGGLILQRNVSGLQDIAKTQEIDALLQEITTLMPPQWWLAPRAAALVGDNSQALHQTIRLMNQFTHYHLLAQLHLPYLLRHSEGGQYEYSKATAVMASREILTRFVSFRGSVSVAAYCRGIDILAFIASTVMSLAHIRARLPQHVKENDRGDTLPMLAHQRLSDRALLEHTLECISKMAEGGKDVLACKISSILERLLDIEDNATKGEPYRTTVSPEPDEAESQHADRASGVGHTLRIHIPYFGTIKIEHRSMSSSVGVEQASLGGESRAYPALDSLAHHRDYHPRGLSQEHGRGGPGVGESIPFTPDPVGCGEHADADGQPFSPERDLPTTGPGVQSGTAALEVDIFDLGHAGVDTTALFGPGSTADVDDWGLQGVDMALFDSLIRGVAEPGADPDAD